MNLSNSFIQYYNDFSSFINNIDITSFTIFDNNDFGFIFEFDDKKYVAQVTYEEITDEKV